MSLPRRLRRHPLAFPERNAPVGGHGKFVQTLRKVDSHSKTCRFSNSIVVKQSKDRRVVCTKQTRSQSRIPGFALRIAARSAKSVFGYFCRAWQKYHPFPLLVGEGDPSSMGGRWCFCCVIKSTIPSPCSSKGALPKAAEGILFCQL